MPNSIYSENTESLYSEYDTPSISIDTVNDQRVLILNPSGRSMENDTKKVAERLNGFYNENGRLFTVVPTTPFDLFRPIETYVPFEAIKSSQEGFVINKALIRENQAIKDLLAENGGELDYINGGFKSIPRPFIIAPRYPLFGPDSNHIMLIQPPFTQNQISLDMFNAGDDLANKGYAVILNPPACGNSRSTAHIQAAKPKEGLEPIKQVTLPEFQIPINEFVHYYSEMVRRGFVFSVVSTGSGNVSSIIHCLPLYGEEASYANQGTECIHPMKILTTNPDTLFALERIQREGPAGFEVGFEMVNQKNNTMTPQERYDFVRDYAQPILAEELREIMSPGHELVNPSFKEHQHRVKRGLAEYSY